MATQTTQVAHAPPHGVKRPHDDEIDNAQRLAKRFHLLNLENQQNGRLWTQPHNAPPATSRHYNAPSDLMNVDDTKDRIYIHDLDAELASVSDADEDERVIFLPDIERNLNRVPHQVLESESRDDATGQEMVLYSVPHSLSVPEGQDSVRKAILESRARTREQQQRGDVQLNKKALSQTGAVSQSQVQQHHQEVIIDYDPDAMDIG